MDGSQALTSMDTKSLEVLSSSHGRRPLLFIAPRAKLAVTPSLGVFRVDRTQHRTLHRMHRSRIPDVSGRPWWLTRLDGGAPGQLSVYVRCERPVIGSIRGNGYDDLNRTHGSLAATEHVRYSDRTRPVCTVDASGAASDRLEKRPVKG